jgi:hypothetical protein
MSRARRVPTPELIGLLGVYVALAVVHQRAVPLFAGPDEQSHVHYAAFLVQRQRLPLFGAEPDVPGEGMQPPLYYLALAPLVAATGLADERLLGELRQISLVSYKLADPSSLRGDSRIQLLFWVRGQRFAVAPELAGLREVRWGTLAFGLLAVALSYSAVRRVSGCRPLALLSAALVGLTPQFLFVSGYVNNDAAAAAVGAAAFYTLSVALERGAPTHRHYAWLALVGAVGVATKLSCLPMLGVSALALFAFDPRPLPRRLRDASIGSGVFLALAAPLFAVNLARSGDPFAMSAVWASAARLPMSERLSDLGAYLTRIYPYRTFESYWALFGWMSLRAPRPVYLAFFALSWTGLLGFLLSGPRGLGRVDAAAQTATRAGVSGGPGLARLRLYLAAVVLATLAAHLWVNLWTNACQGRHLFGAAPQIACLLALGIGRLVSGHPFRLGWSPAIGVSGAVAALALYCVVVVIAPTNS